MSIYSMCSWCIYSSSSSKMVVNLYMLGEKFTDRECMSCEFETQLVGPNQFLDCTFFFLFYHVLFLSRKLSNWKLKFENLKTKLFGSFTTSDDSLRWHQLEHCHVCARKKMPSVPVGEYPSDRHPILGLYIHAYTPACRPCCYENSLFM